METPVIYPLLSGGIDSYVATKAFLAHSPSQVHALSFDYGQRHRVELEYAARICNKEGWRHTVISLPVIAGSALTDPELGIPNARAPQSGTVVPGRNLLLVSAAVSFAVAVGGKTVLIGCNKDDAADYPDCRAGFIREIGSAVFAAYGVTLVAPLINFKKDRVVSQAPLMGVDVSECWSCYEGGETPCGVCGACVLRGAASDNPVR